ncbi:MAG: hypothetical protein ACOC29_03510, partial [Candidatus Sumerlaeota bacterium]
MNKRLKMCIVFPASLLVTAVAMYLGFVLLGIWFRPDLDAPLPTYPEEEIERVRKARNPQLRSDDPPVIWQDVDYSEGESAAWWPKEQSPLLDPLTEDGTLPPLS